MDGGGAGCRLPRLVLRPEATEIAYEINGCRNAFRLSNDPGRAFVAGHDQQRGRMSCMGAPQRPDRPLGQPAVVERLGRYDEAETPFREQKGWNGHNIFILGAAEPGRRRGARRTSSTRGPGFVADESR